MVYSSDSYILSNNIVDIFLNMGQISTTFFIHFCSNRITCIREISLLRDFETILNTSYFIPP